MPLQTATTGQLEDAQRIAIEETRFTAEHNAPMLQLIEKMRLAQGEKSITVPKVGQMTAANLTDGVDLTASEDIGMTTVSLTSGEVGLKVILTDKLVRQENEDVFRIVGRQMGDAMARKKDIDVLNLFSALGATLDGDIGAGGFNLEIQNVTAAIAYAKANKFPMPISFVHHPWAVFDISRSVSTGATAGDVPNSIMPGFMTDLLQDFYSGITLNRVPIFEDGNIAEDASGDGVGAIFSMHAMVHVEQLGFTTARERDESLRATEVIVLSDYGVFELDDTYGAPVTAVVSARALA